MNETQFETELIQYLTTGMIKSREKSDDINQDMIRETSDYIVKTKFWRYEPNIKTTEALWRNFKQILEQHNQKTLKYPLSEVEFNQVKKIISDLSPEELIK